MKKGSFYFLSFLLICFSLNVFAQDDDKDVKTIALVPQYMLNNGIKVDFEFKLASEKQWINIAPQFYIDAEGNKEFDSGARDDFYDEMVGIGIDVSHKIFLTEKELPFGSYFGYGLTNQFFSLKYEGSVTEPYYENGLQYWRTVSKVANSSILKIGPNIFIGYQAEFVMVDVIASISPILNLQKSLIQLFGIMVISVHFLLGA